MKKFKLLPHYYEEIPDKLRSPDSEYYLGESILSRYPRIKDHIGTLEKKEMEILVKYMKKGIYCGGVFSERDVVNGFSLIPTASLSDGKYCWAESHIYYMKNYQLNLPESFKKYVYSLNGDYKYLEKIDERLLNEEIGLFLDDPVEITPESVKKMYDKDRYISY